MPAVATTFDHEADIGVAGEGATPAEAFAAAAQAMFSVVADIDKVRPRKSVPVACSASNLEILFVKWLNVLLSEAALRHMVFCSFELLIRENRLVGWARGECFDPKRHGRGVEVKGATLTQLRVRCKEGIWRAQTVVDV